MPQLPLRDRFTVEPLGADGYQEFAAGAIPIKRALACDRRSPVVFVEHAQGFQRAFDRHLGAVLKATAPARKVHYQVTWAGVTAGPAGPPLVRLELAIDGLKPRVRLLFRGGLLPPLWFLARGAQLGLLLEPVAESAEATLAHVWVLGRSPARRGLRRFLRSLEIPTPRQALRADPRLAHPVG
jgi:hypothetical protein